MFSATYDNYFILLEHDVGEVRIRYRVLGSDNSTSNYDRQTIRTSAGTTLITERQTGQNIGLITTNSGNGNTAFYIFNPFLTKKTNLVASSGNGNSFTNTSTIQNQTLSFDGFTVFPGSGTLTGNIKIFGVKN